MKKLTMWEIIFFSTPALFPSFILKKLVRWRSIKLQCR